MDPIKLPKSLKLPKEKVGKFAEQCVEIYIRGRGFHLQKTNFHARWGEIDLIAYDGEILCFIEVRARQSATLGSALESIGPKKLARLQKAAEIYLMELDSIPPCRFDLATIDYRENCYTLSYLENFFTIL